MKKTELVKEPYEAPDLRVVPLELRDVIATSDGTPGRDPWETDILSHGGATI